MLRVAFHAMSCRAPQDILERATRMSLAPHAMPILFCRHAALELSPRFITMILRCFRLFHDEGFDAVAARLRYATPILRYATR